MRFKRLHSHPYEITSRKRAGVELSQRRKREKLPLLAEIIRQQQPDVDAVLDERAEKWIKNNQESRDSRAASWRKARQKIENYDPQTRAAVLNFWNNHRWFPGDPVQLLCILHMLETGRFIVKADTLEDPQPVFFRRDLPQEQQQEDPQQLLPFTGKGEQ